MLTERSRSRCAFRTVVSFSLFSLSACGAEPEQPSGTQDLAEAAVASILAVPGGKKNRLAQETSPYLKLHAENPVDWYSWGPEAFEAARKSKKLIFLSIGYSSCHWCHVMNRESFSDPKIAALMNEHFICIKVDREERPDVDKIYMNAVQAMNLGGGWPLSVFLLPDGRPFYGGTYFPPKDRIGPGGQIVMYGFPRVIEGVVDFYENRREAVEKQAEAISASLRRAAQTPLFGQTRIEPDLVIAAAKAIPNQFDPVHGGLGFPPSYAPKFPQPSTGLFLLEVARARGRKDLLEPVIHQAERMARGGIYDQVGGGFHRYSVDRQWVVPHFEKMLYDQAQLLSLYSRLYEQDPKPMYRRVVDETVTFVRREMTSPCGLFYSALNADSEHEEGKFYVWTKRELKEILGEDSKWILPMTGADGEPNFEEGNRRRYILELRRTPAAMAKELGISELELLKRWDRSKARLLAARARRIRPLLDTKAITFWNALFIVGLVDAAEVFDRAEYRNLAVTAAISLLENLRYEDGRLARHWIDGQAKGSGYCDDYAASILGLLAVHRLDPQPVFLRSATELADTLLELFWDEESKNFFYAPKDRDPLFAPLKESYDGATPSSNSLAVLALVELSDRTSNALYRKRAFETFGAHGVQLQQAPGAVTTMLRALHRFFEGKTDPTLAGKSLGKPLAKNEPIRKIEIVPAAFDVIPGESFTFQVRITVAKGWHINANPASPKYLRPTVVDLLGDSRVQLKKLKYPKSKDFSIEGMDEPIKVYEGTVIIDAEAIVKKDMPSGKSNFDLQISYQACDDKRCLAPSKRVISVPLTVTSNK